MSDSQSQDWWEFGSVLCRKAFALSIPIPPKDRLQGTTPHVLRQGELRGQKTSVASETLLYDSPGRQILELKDKKGKEVECHFSSLFQIYYLYLQRKT